MKATLARAEFAAALAAISPAIPPRPTMPILSCVHMTVADGRMTIRATDYELVIERVVELEAGDDGVALVSGLRLRDLVSKLAGTTVDLVMEGDGLHVTAGRSKYRLATYPAAEYPEVPVVPPPTGTTTAAALDYALRAISHAVDNTEATTGVIVEVVDKKLWAATTDRFRLGASPMPWKGKSLKTSVLFNHLTAAVKNFEPDDDVTVSLDKNRLALTTPTASVSMSVLAKDIVKWQAFLALEATQEHTLSRDEFANAVARAELVSERDQALEVEIADESMTIQSADTSGDANEVLDVEGAGEIRWLLNGTYLTAMLSRVTEDRISIASSSPLKPLLIRGIKEDGTPGSAVHVIMPRRK